MFGAAANLIKYLAFYWIDIFQAGRGGILFRDMLLLITFFVYDLLLEKIKSQLNLNMFLYRIFDKSPYLIFLLNNFSSVRYKDE